MIDLGFGRAELVAIAPFAVVTLFAMGILLYETFYPREDRGSELPFWFSILGLSIAGVLSLTGWREGAPAFSGTFALDGVTVFTNLICIFSAGLSLMMAVHFMEAVGVRAR